MTKNTGNKATGTNGKKPRPQPTKPLLDELDKRPTPYISYTTTLIYCSLSLLFLGAGFREEKAYGTSGPFDSNAYDFMAFVGGYLKNKKVGRKRKGCYMTGQSLWF
jgi:hypothetical protein